MKKGLKLLLVLSLLAGIAGCGTKKTEEESKEEVTATIKEPTAIAVDQQYETGSLALELIKIDTTNTVESLSHHGDSKECKEGYQYVDMIFSVTNNGTELFRLMSGAINANFKDEDNNEYDEVEYYIEKDEELKDYTGIQKGQTNTLHIAYVLPENITKGTAYFEIEDTAFNVDYDSSVVVDNPPLLAINQSLTTDNFTFMITECKFTSYIEPPVLTDGSGVFFFGDNSQGWYTVYFSITNTTANSIPSYGIGYIDITFDNQYNYTDYDYIIYITQDQTNFEYAGDFEIAPGETRTGFFMLQLPSVYQNYNADVKVYVGGNEYRIA